MSIALHATQEHLMGELINQEDTLQCIRCGLCAYSCPTYRVQLCESVAPRGRVALLRAVAEGKLEAEDLTPSKLFDCVLCAACTNACPGGMQVDHLLFRARHRLFEAGFLPASLSALLGQIGGAHNIAGEANGRRLLWTENMAQPPQALARQEAEVVYFVGCVGSFFPASYSIPQAFAYCLEDAGIPYGVLGEREHCCGYPALISGDWDLARESGRHNLGALGQMRAGAVVTTCPSCYHMFSHVYPNLLGLETGDLKVLHASELLADLISSGQLTPGRVDMSVTYHDPCDLGRKSKIFEPPRRVLEAIPGLELVEMVNNRSESLCCGGGGNVETSSPALAEAMAARRLSQALESGAEAIVTACQQCKRTLSSAARRQKARLRTYDLVEIVARSLEGTG